MKSYVTMEQKVCKVCTEKYDTGALLLDKRLKEVFDTNTTTGWGMCPTCETAKANGYIALVGIDPDKSDINTDTNTLKPKDAYRTGVIVHIRQEAWNDIMKVPIPPEGICFVEPAVVASLKILMHPDDRIKAGLEEITAHGTG